MDTKKQGLQDYCYTRQCVKIPNSTKYKVYVSRFYLFE